MEQIGNPKISSFILHFYRHLLNGNNESVEKIGTDDLKIPRFSEEDLSDLCNSAILTLKQINKTLINIPSPSIVIGDLHGNLHDLIRILNSIIDVFSNRVLFLGDYIDRGQFQLETITLLLALRIEYPDHFFMIRGNHEFDSVNSYGGFKDEILKSGYSESLFNKFNEAFSWLPIAAVINDRIFCVHGGLSPLLHEVEQIKTEFKLPIKNIYTSSTNPSKKKNKNADSSASKVANLNLRSSLNNVNANLSTNMSFFQLEKKKTKLSDASEPKWANLNVKPPLLNSLSPDPNSNLKSHPPKFLPLCKKSNYEMPISKKLPPLGSKTPLMSLPDVNINSQNTNSQQKPSISPSINVNSELENSIANFPNQKANPQSTNTNSQSQNTTNTNSQLQNTTNTNSQLQNTTNTNSQLQNTTNTNSQLQNTTNTNSQLQNTTNTNSQLQNTTNTNQQSQNQINLNLQLQNQTSSTLNNQLQQQNQSLQEANTARTPNSNSISPSFNSSQILTDNPVSLGTKAFYISSSQLAMMAKYKELQSLDDDQNNTELLTDLMWSDPTNSCELFLPSNRGSGCYFGFVTTNHFLKKNGLKMIVRGHESIKTGIKTSHEKKVVTIYSSSSIQLGGIAGCAIFDTDDTYKEFKLIPINFVQRGDAKFYTPTVKQNNNNSKPLKLNSFNRSQNFFGNGKKLRKNTKGLAPQSTNSSPSYHENMMADIETIKEEP